MEIHCKITSFIAHFIFMCAISDAFNHQSHKTTFLNCNVIDSNLNSIEISDVFILPIELSNDTKIKCVSKGIVTNEELMETIKEFSSQNFGYDFEMILYNNKDGKIVYDGAILKKEIYERVLDIYRQMSFEITFTIPANQESKILGILQSIEYNHIDEKQKTHEVNSESNYLNAIPTRSEKIIESNSPKITNLVTLKIVSSENEETTVIADITVTTEATFASQRIESLDSSAIETVKAETSLTTKEDEVTEETVTENILTEYESTDVKKEDTVTLLSMTKFKNVVLTKDDVPFYTLPIFIAVITIASFITAVVIVTLCLYHLYAPKIDSPDHNTNGPELVNVTRVKTVEDGNENNSVNNVNSINDIV